ncbi:hypothetical protein [Ammoniphilus resinae]|uniref:Uncharacterized protein n=1 Tax=Ammoniphilus resinae TaxID=861532 RepID=A0ABS4GSV1_9BACL|nr:hypothetical protein [Ammoniphilus resinae]MBP1933207.1 hypothetical protein [Ammoniphilus resinae]
MLFLLLSCIVLLGLSILTASPKEVHNNHQEEFVPEEYLTDLV